MGTSFSRRRGSGAAATYDGGGDASARERTATEVERSFPQFGLLGDELAIEVLSFVAHGPYERGLDYPRGTLTHVLPMVCRRFRQCCDCSEVLWMPSLERLVSSNPESWESGVLSILSSVRSIPLAPSTVMQVYHGGDIGNHAVKQAFNQSQGVRVESGGFNKGERLRSMIRDEIRQLLQIVCKIALQQAWRKVAAKQQISENDEAVQGNDKRHGNCFGQFCPAKIAYCCLIKEHMMTKMPVFYMPSPVIVGRFIGLHFFEPRYRRLIAEVTAGRPTHELSGGPMSGPLPRFVYAHNSPLAAGTSAFIVEVHRCRMYINGRADVWIKPVKSVRLEKVEERPGSDGLYDVLFRRA